MGLRLSRLRIGPQTGQRVRAWEAGVRLVSTDVMPHVLAFEACMRTHERFDVVAVPFPYGERGAEAATDTGRQLTGADPEARGCSGR